MLWKQSRLSLLLLTFCGVLLLLGKVIWFPVSSKEETNSNTASNKDSFIFPEKIPLPPWQQVTSQPLNQSKVKDFGVTAQKSYRYVKNQLPMDIEMRYVKYGDVPFLIKTFTSISTSASVRQHKEIGFYGVGIDKRRAYLSACINPQGYSTFTIEQLNQNIHNLNSKNILSWLQGRRNLRDNRCLWTHLSLSLENSSAETAYQTLENVWVSWYHWWQPRFPEN